LDSFFIHKQIYRQAAQLYFKINNINKRIGERVVGNQHLHFNTTIGRQKPESIRNKEQPCPFCAREQLTDIIDTDGPIILLKNKYPVLGDAYQTVLIETDDCQGEISKYDDDFLEKLITFGLKHWMALEDSKHYKSVLFFKNHGPLSGGSIAHPHMQIIGLHDIDYKEKINKECFQGYVIDSQDGVQFTLSTKPSIGFYEFNVKLTSIEQVGPFSKYLKTAVSYLLNHFPFNCSSYNLFFYDFNGEIYVKIVPRFITTPIYIGYNIPQIPSNLEWMVEDIQKHYFQLEK
jgi:ATP adenylyltransferase/5',5'''-P-1,P-4-tetraphosphate phosphorylase II